MGLAHGRRQPARPGAVALAEPAVAVARGLPSAILLPQQGQGDAWPAQLQVEHCPVGLGPGRGALGRRREQQPLQGRIVELTGQWPGECGASCPGDVLAGRGRPDAHRTGDPPLGQATGKMEAQHLPDLPHGQSLGGHRGPLTSGAKGREANPRLQIIQRRWGSSVRSTASTPSSHGWSRSTGISGRVQLECLVAFAWNRWSQSTGKRKSQAGRHPRRHFRGLLRLHSRYGPSDCSTA